MSSGIRTGGEHEPVTSAGRPRDLVYDVVAAFAARLAFLGVTDAVVSPGSRSTPLTLCFDAQPRIRTWIQIDERSAGFFALGLGIATGRPAVMVCTSGTAAANYLPAVVEASHAGVPLIVCTADRPPDMRGWGSPQTIDQVGLYGSAVRMSVDLPVADDLTEHDVAGWADRAFEAATGADRGPVHLNWPLREPLEPRGSVPVVLSGARHEGAPLEPRGSVPTEPNAAREVAQEEGLHQRLDNRSRGLATALRELAEVVSACERGVVVAGPWPGGGWCRQRIWAAETLHFAAWAGWPVIGDPLSGVRCDRLDIQRSGGYGSGADVVVGDTGGIGDERVVVVTAEHLLSCEAFGNRMRPDAVVLVGRPVTAKAVRLWLERSLPTHVIQIDPENRWDKAVFRLTGHVPASVEALRSVAAPDAVARSMYRAERVATDGWLASWRRADAAALQALIGVVRQGPLLSASVARTLVGALPDEAVLMLSNSMPVRDIDAYVDRTGSLFCAANRGASGIDGIVSTALGLAAATPTRAAALYTGDLALLHDLAGLTAASRLGLHLTVVCVDNDGGEIFSILPIADSISRSDFRRLFRTPHGTRFEVLNGFGGIRARRVTDTSELTFAVSDAITTRAPGVDLIVVPVSADADVAQRRALTAAAQAAVG